MSNLPDPEDIDVFVGGVEPEPTASIETERIIEAHKKRPDHARKVEEAKRLLATLGINTPNSCVPDPNSLLEHWRGCVAELLKRDFGGTNGTGADNKDLGIGARGPRDEADTLKPGNAEGTIERAP